MHARLPTDAMLFVLVAMMGCGGADGTGSKEKPSAPAATAQLATAPKDPHGVLAALDTRKPVPLVPMMANHQKQNMRDHLVAVQEIVTSVAAGDFAAIEKAAGRIGYSEQMGTMCTHMGAGAPGFTEAALKFHHTADSIAEAAKQKDAQAVLTALSVTLAACTSCHSTFKQEVVDDTTWASVAKQPAPTGAMHP